MIKMLEDGRDIAEIETEDQLWCVGESNVDEIEVYGEPGQSAYVPWFAIYSKGELVVRVNAALVETVVYAEEK